MPKKNLPYCLVLSVLLVFCGVCTYWSAQPDTTEHTLAEQRQRVSQEVVGAPTDSADTSTPAPASSDPTQVAQPRKTVLHPTPGMVIIIDDMGYSVTQAHELMASGIPLVFSILPDSPQATETANAVHKARHEVFIHLPMQAQNSRLFPAEGGTITPTSDEIFMEKQLREALRKIPHAMGINNHMGSKATTNALCMDRLCRVLTSTQLVVVDSMTHPDSVFYNIALQYELPALQRTFFLDHTPKTKDILASLRQAEKRAKTACVVVIGHPHPQTLAALRQWIKIRDVSVPVLRLQQLFGTTP